MALLKTFSYGNQLTFCLESAISSFCLYPTRTRFASIFLYFVSPASTGSRSSHHEHLFSSLWVPPANILGLSFLFWATHVPVALRFLLSSLCIAARLIPAGCVPRGLLRTSFQIELSSEIGEQEKERNQGTSPQHWSVQGGVSSSGFTSFVSLASIKELLGMILFPIRYPWLCPVVLYNIKSYKEAWPLEHQPPLFLQSQGQ